METFVAITLIMTFYREDLKRVSESAGWTINVTKTKIMTNINNLQAIKTNNHPIELVSGYKYLEKLISFMDDILGTKIILE